MGNIVRNPIEGLIQQGDVAAELQEFAQIPFTIGGFARNYINFSYHADDGSDLLYVAESKGGRIWIVDAGGEVAAEPFLDLKAIYGDGFYDGNSTSGLRTFAFHPDFEVEGAAGEGKVYTMATMAPESAPADVEIMDGPFEAFSHSTLTEWSIDPEDPSRLDPTSARELFRVSEPLRTHNSEQLMFNPNARPGDADYGLLYVTVSDGQASPTPDPFQEVQDLSSPRGKILLLDPLAQPDGAAYRAPADNPFVDEPGALDVIWALGVRHSENLTFDTGGTGRIFFTDIGQFSLEEVNVGVKGGNYGWPLREGTLAQSPDGVSHPQTGAVFELPPDDAAFAYLYPVAQYDHDEGYDVDFRAAIVGGYVYRGATAPALEGLYLFGDIVSGRIFYVREADLVLGEQAEIRELILTVDGAPTTLLEIMGDEVGAGRVDLRFGQDRNGDIYVTSKQNGKIYKLLPSEFAPGETIIGGGDDDTLIGGGYDDMLEGRAGDDRLEGHDGDDVLQGDDGDDSLVGGAGDDEIEGHRGDDQAYGGPGADEIWGHAGRDVAFGNAGDDLIKAGPDSDLVFGNAGDDRVYGQAGDDRVLGGAGDDAVFGDNGDDWLAGDAGADAIYGGTGDDVIGGGDGDDVIRGGAGHDELRGGAGSDLLIGGGGEDVFIFEAGDGDAVVQDFQPLGDQVLFQGVAFAAADLVFETVGGDLAISTPIDIQVLLIGLAGVSPQDLNIAFE